MIITQLSHIVLVDRLNSNEHSGGDTVQITEIANFLQASGYIVTVTNQLNELIDSKKPVDLFILFNLTNPIELIFQWQFVQKFSAPYILFPVYWNLKKAIPSDVYAGFIRKSIEILPDFLFHLLRTFKMIVKREPRFPGVSLRKYIFFKKEILKLINGTSAVYVNSFAEKKHLISEFRLKSIEHKVKVIRNGININEVISSEATSSKSYQDYICCVGGIGPRKNQLRLIEAANLTNIKLLIIGKPSKGTESYYEKCREISGDNIYFTGHLSREETLLLLQNSNGHIQPSYIETPGLASLEAAAMGCKIAVSNVPPVNEYFGEFAIYCDPNKAESIREALIELWNASNTIEKRNRQKEHFVKNYSWHVVLEPLKEDIGKIISKYGRTSKETEVNL